MVKAGENDFLEFKRKASFPEKIVKEIVAFANTRGGDLLIGVDDNGTIPGLKFAEEDAWVLDNAIQQYCWMALSRTQASSSANFNPGIVPLSSTPMRRSPPRVLAKATISFTIFSGKLAFRLNSRKSFSPAFTIAFISLKFILRSQL